MEIPKPVKREFKWKVNKKKIYRNKPERLWWTIQFIFSTSLSKYHKLKEKNQNRTINYDNVVNDYALKVSSTIFLSIEEDKREEFDFLKRKGIYDYYKRKYVQGYNQKGITEINFKY